MRSTILTLLLIIPLLSACTQGGDVTVAAPPASTEVQTTNNAQIDSLIAQWRKDAPQKMIANAIKQETIEEHVYTSTASLADIETFYKELTNKGWIADRRLLNAENDTFAILGFEQGVTSMTVGAIDAQKFGGTGTVIYTVKGNK